MLKNKYISTLIIVFFSTAMNAQILTYDSLKTVILKENPELEMYRQNIDALDAMTKGAKSWEAPQIGMGLFMTPYNSANWQPHTRTVDGMQMPSAGMGSFKIQGRQMITNPSKLNANQKYMQALSSVTIEEKNTTANELLYSAKKTFFEIQLINRKLAILKEAQNTMDIIIALGEDKIAYSKGSISSIYKAKSQRAQIQNEISMLDSKKKQNLYMLNALMNNNDNNLFSVDTIIGIRDYDTDFLDTSFVKSNRSDIQAINQNIEVTRLKQKTEAIKSRPDFGIEFGHMFAFGSNPNMFTLMGMMSIPIAPWSSKNYKSNTLAYNYQMKALANQKQALINKSISMLYSLKNEIHSTKQQVNLFNAVILPSLKKSYEFAMLAYTQNTGDLFEALEARMNLQMAQMQNEDTILKLLLLQAEYEKELQIL